jgi:hypothetical protein
MRCEALALAIALAIAAIGCTPTLCSRTSDCAGGLVCTQAGACAIPVDTSGDAGADGTVRDAATDAAAITDAASDAARDAGEIDAAVGAAFHRDLRIQRIRPFWRRGT